MTAVPAPTIILPREEWNDADFDLPEGATIPAPADSDREDEEDWDAEMDLGKTGTARVSSFMSSITTKLEASRSVPHMFTIRPPLPVSPEDDEEDDEGVSTIKVAALPKVTPKAAPPSTIDEDFEDDFSLPTDLTQLSLAPLSLAHRSSKSSLEWGDKETSSSSQSSDAYSTLGFADHSPSSNYTSASLPETESEQDDEGDLDGLVLPTGLFDSGSGASKLVKLLDVKKKTAYTDDRVKIASPDPEDDFEIGLVLDDDTEFSPSRLMQTVQKPKRAVPPPILRSKSVPPRTTTVARPPSRLKAERAKSPSNPPVSSATQLRKLNAPPSPPRPPSVTRAQTYSQALIGPPPSAPSFLSPKPGSLRIQKSHSGLKPPSPPASRKLARKASLPSLSDNNIQHQASGSGTASGSGVASSSQLARYETPTASSRAKTHTNSASRIHGLDYNVPPTRPSTPSSNPVALRLTMPTSSSRLKSRTPVSSIFPPSATATAAPPLPRSTSPLPPPRPPSSTSLKGRHTPSQSLPLPPVKVLKRPKRQKTYGDGTELDGIDDLPLDREKEGRFRVQPKGYGNRIPGATYASKVAEPKPVEPSVLRGTLRRSKKRDLSGGSADLAQMAPPTKTLKRAELPPTTSPEPVKKKKIPSSPSGHTRRKPTLIRNLGSSNTPKGRHNCSSTVLCTDKRMVVVVGEMKWNPNTLRWEGNDQALRDFDVAVGTSTRPALITHLTGSSIGSPVGSFASGARVVGNMIFDPSRMCWISTLPPEEEEPDVFADLADDEDEDDWEAKGGTIKAIQQGSTINTGAEPPNPARSHTRSMSESESDRGSRASMVCNVDEAFLESCRAAEERHRSEMRGWIPTRGDPFTDYQERAYLHEIRALATRQY
ncbi:hypothetical protein BXZ70DRAFT_928773 [Cristinia sonorae]|uniref:Protein byr4 n=1 Tax=Cristinia sonorae TaxID=1940300 RepID=A0A8K0UST5_9AGAR|nr:hypothetical protein BXZ70DRAFT_928773 [Cristinia sonorae]